MLETWKGFCYHRAGASVLEVLVSLGWHLVVPNWYHPASCASCKFQLVLRELAHFPTKLHALLVYRSRESYWKRPN